jgi:exopolysaccharide biosynthesis polyprenyl glycosylphosphotransferase
MSLAQRLAWFEGLATVGILALVAAASSTPPAAGETATGLVVRGGLIAAVCLACLYFCDLYDFDRPQDFGALFARLCRAVGWSAVLLALAYLLFPGAVVPGLASHALLPVLAALLVIRVGVYRLAKRGPFCERVLILGTGSLARRLAEQLHGRPDLPVRLLGVLGDDGRRAPSVVPHLGGYQEVAEVVRRHRPDRIVVAMADRRGRLPVGQLLACRVRGVRIEEGAHVYERLNRRLAVEALTPSGLIFGDGFRVTSAQLLVKRALSVVIALTALVAAAPLMGLIALAIRLETPGPVFFVQERVGLHGRRFRLIKFRTMRTAPAAEPDTVLRDNRSRVTRVGAVLRRYRLDELPQFINILRGDMSLVGPRPEMVENVATFSAVIPYYDLRHEVRPGLTGWAQVRAGYSMSIEEVTRKLCYDLYYIKHMSLLFDLRILFDTVKFVLSGRRPG